MCIYVHIFIYLCIWRDVDIDVDVDEDVDRDADVCGDIYVDSGRFWVWDRLGVRRARKPKILRISAILE